LNPEEGTDRLHGNVGKKLPLLAALTTQKNAVLGYFAREA
jgi:hypothetical protein